jgi:ankyrin repeat protein
MAINKPSSLAVLSAGLAVVLSVGAAGAQEPADRWYGAIRDNNLNAVESLAKSGSVNEKDKRGSTPLMHAAAFGSIEAMRILLVHGADVNARNDFGATALMWAIGDQEKARLLVANGADVNARSKMGKTPLLLAAANDGASGTVKLLLDHGAAMAVRDDMQSTALLAAAYANDLATIRLLLDRGDAVNEHSANGMTPLMRAAQNGNLKAVEWLLARRADVNAVSAAETEQPVKNGAIAMGSWTPLLLAAVASGPDVVKALLDAGARIDAQDVRQMTPLMLAVASDHADPRTVRLLLNRGANTVKRDRDGLTVVDWAKKYNAPMVLREFGLTRERAPEARVIVPTALLRKADPAQAAARSVELLQKSSGSFFAQGGCGACHSQNLTAVAVHAAWMSHIPVNEQARAGELKGAQLGLSSFEQPLLQRMDPPVPDILTYALFQLGVEGAPADRTTDAIVHNLAAQQRQAGNWHLGGIARPPMQDGDISRTALAIYGLQRYAPAGRQAEFHDRVVRAAAWLRGTKPKTTEDLAMQLLGLKWAGDRTMAREGLRRLAFLQRGDGGWAQNPNLATDAYATGMALYTIREMGEPVSGLVYRRGVEYLLQTQQSDGSWFVGSRAVKLQPYFESGFAHGPDQWISSAATAWATAALSYAAAPQQLARAR